MTSRCVVIAGGEFTAKLAELINKDDFIIAADSGYEYCKKFGISSNLIVGDFDSYKGELPIDTEIIKLPTRKDDTDLLFAAKCGVKKGFTNFLILGGYGSRPDQCFAMYQTLLWIKEQNPAAEVAAHCSGFEVYVLLNSSKSFSSLENRYLSVFSLYERAEGVCISGGAEYPLNDATVTAGFPIGVSNCTKGSDITVSVKKGALLVMVVDKNI